MLYSVELNVSIDVDAVSKADAINKASLEVTFGTDVYNVSVIDVECLEEQDASDNEWARRVL